MPGGAPLKDCGPGGGDVFYVFLKVAATLPGRVSVNWQLGLVPRQAPCQRANRQPLDGFAVSFNGPGTKLWLQARPQVIPRGRLVTAPRPTFETRSVTSVFVKAAVTAMSPFTDTEQVGSVPVQALPDQPEKVDPGSGVAVKLTVWL
jgi:hypothetical protein